MIHFKNHNYMSMNSRGGGHKGLLCQNIFMTVSFSLTGFSYIFQYIYTKERMALFVSYVFR